MSSAAADAGPLNALVGFGRELRARGLPVGTGRVLAFCRAAAALVPLDRDRLYWAGRTTLVADRRNLAAYDATFDAWFGRTSADVLNLLREQLSDNLAGQAAAAVGEL